MHHNILLFPVLPPQNYGGEGLKTLRQGETRPELMRWDSIVLDKFTHFSKQHKLAEYVMLVYTEIFKLIKIIQ